MLVALLSCSAAALLCVSCVCAVGGVWACGVWGGVWVWVWVGWGGVGARAVCAAELAAGALLLFVPTYLSSNRRLRGCCLMGQVGSLMIDQTHGRPCRCAASATVWPRGRACGWEIRVVPARAAATGLLAVQAASHSHLTQARTTPASDCSVPCAGCRLASRRRALAAVRAACCRRCAAHHLHAARHRRRRPWWQVLGLRRCNDMLLINSITKSATHL